MIQIHLQQARQQHRQNEFQASLGTIEDMSTYPIAKHQYFDIYYLAAANHLSLENIETAIAYAEKAEKVASGTDQHQRIEALLDHLTLRDNKSSNDPENRKQFWIHKMGIHKARKNISSTKEHPVTIAVIDNGIDADHPDMKGQVWSNEKEIAGDNKDNDANGYIDDITGRNFLKNNRDMTPYGAHGTQVA